MLAVVLLGQLMWALLANGLAALKASARRSRPPRACGVLGRVLFTDYMFAFEVTSILIIAAMVGAVVLGGKKGS